MSGTVPVSLPNHIMLSVLLVPRYLLHSLKLYLRNSATVQEEYDTECRTVRYRKNNGRRVRRRQKDMLRQLPM